MAPRSFHIRPLIPILLALLALSSGCAESQVKHGYDKSVDFLFDVHSTTCPLYTEDPYAMLDYNEVAGLRLAAQLYWGLPDGSPIYVTPFTDMSRPDRPTIFGRMLAGQVATRLVRGGRMVMDGPPPGSLLPAPAPDKAAPPKFGTKDDTAAPKEATPAAPDAPAASAASTAAATPATPAPADSTPPAAPANAPAPEDLPRPCVLSGHYLPADSVVYCSAQIVTLKEGETVASYDWILPVNDQLRALLPQLRKDGAPEPNVRTKF